MKDDVPFAAEKTLRFLHELEKAQKTLPAQALTKNILNPSAQVLVEGRF